MASFTVNGKRYPIPEKLNLGQLRTLEDAAGGPAPLEAGGTAATIGLLLVSMQAQDPSVTLEDVLELDPAEITSEEEKKKRPPARKGAKKAS